jgi:hypothetical protein
LLPRVVNKICYRIKHACFHSSSHSPRFAGAPSASLGECCIQRCTRVRRHTVFHNLTTRTDRHTPLFQSQKVGINTHTHTHGQGKLIFLPPAARGPPRPPLTELRKTGVRRGTDALRSTTVRLYSSAAARAAAPRHPRTRCQGTKCKGWCRRAQRAWRTSWHSSWNGNSWWGGVHVLSKERPDMSTWKTQGVPSMRTPTRLVGVRIRSSWWRGVKRKVHETQPPLTIRCR